MLRSFNTSLSSSETFVKLGKYNSTENNIHTYVDSDREVAIVTVELYSASASTITIKKYNTTSGQASFVASISLEAGEYKVLSNKDFFNENQRISFSASSTTYLSVSFEECAKLDI